MTMTEELLFYLARTTLALAVAVMLTASLLRVARVTSPAVHRVGCILALAVGWSFLQWPVSVPWYEPPAAAPSADVLALDEPPAPPAVLLKSGVSFPEPLFDINSQGALEEATPATIELPHIDLAQPLAVTEPPTEPISEPADTDAPQIAAAPPNVAAPLEPALELPTEPEPASTVEVSDEVVASVALVPAPRTWEYRDFAPHTAAIWAAGICLLVLAWLVGYVRFVWRLPAARDADAEWLHQWRSLLTDHDIHRAVPLRVTADMGPMLCRLPRGYELLIPGPLWQELNATERAAILRHELAHLVRCDVWKSLGVRVMALPHWFNPFSWWAVRRFDEAAEWACDCAASGEHATTMYARALVRLGEVAGRHASYSPAARGRPLAARIRRLLAGRLREESSIKKALLLAACTGFALAALVRVELVAREAKDLVAVDTSGGDSQVESEKVAKAGKRFRIEVDAPQRAIVGAKGTLLVTLTNTSPVSLKDVSIAVNLDKAIEPHSATDGHIWVNDALTWEFRELGIGKTNKYQIQTRFANLPGEAAIKVRVSSSDASEVLRVPIIVRAVADSEASPGERGDKVAVNGLAALSAEMHDDVIRLTDEEISARGLQLVTATAAPPEEVKLSGQTSLIPDRTAFIRPLLPGRVEQIDTVAGGLAEKPRPIGVGTAVKKGQVLAQIWNMEVNGKEIDLVAAYAEQELALTALNRLNNVAEKGAVSAVALREAERQVQVNKIAIDKIERTIRAWGVEQGDIEKLKTLATKINSTEDKSLAANDVPGTYPIVSPIDGTLLERHANVGDVVDTARKIFTVADISRLQILAQTSLGIVPRLKDLPPESRHWAVVATYLSAGEPLQGTFDIESIAEREPSRILLHGDVDNSKGLLKAGQAITAAITFSDDAAAVMISPRAFIDEGGDRGSVLVQSKEDPARFELRAVKVISRRGTRRGGLAGSVRVNEHFLVTADALEAGQELLAVVATEERPTPTAAVKSESQAPGQLSDVTKDNADQEAPPVAQPTRDTALAGRGDGAPAQAATGPATPRYPEVIEAARAGYEAARRAYDQDTITLDTVCAWSVRWLHAEGSSELVVENDAEADLPGGPGEPSVRSPSDAERIGFVRAHLARMKELQARVLALYKIGARGGEAEKKAMMDYYVADAERDLKRLQSHMARQDRAKAALAGVERGDDVQVDSSERPKQGIRFSHAGSTPKAAPRTPWQPKADAGRDRLRYEGRSFADWLAQLDAELSLGKRKETIAALTAFGQRGFGSEVTTKLVELLADEDLREYAIRALGRLGPTASEAIPALEEAAKQDRYRQDAVQALALIRGEKIDISPPAADLEARNERQRREVKLNELLAQKSDELARDLQDIDRLQKSLGIAQSADAPAQIQMLQQQLETLNKSILSHNAQRENLEVEIDKYKLDIELAKDPDSIRAQVEEEIHKDVKLQKLEEQKQELELGITDAKNQIKSQDNPTLKRLQKSLASVEEKIEIRRDELRKRFSDADQSAKIKEYEGKLKATEKHRDAVKRQLNDLSKQRADLVGKLKVVTRDTAELDLREHKVQAIKQLIEELNRDLQKLQVEKQSSQASKAKPDATAVTPVMQSGAATVPEAKLRQQLAEKNDQLARDVQELNAMAGQLKTLEQQFAATNERIAALTQSLRRLDQDVEQRKLELKPERNHPQFWLLGQAELGKDEKLKKLIEQKKEIEEAVAGAKKGAGGDPTLERLEKSLARTDEKIAARRDEVLERFSESDQFTAGKKNQAMLKAVQEQREAVSTQLAELKKDREQLAKTLLPLTLRGCEFEVKRSAVEELQQVVERLHRDLHLAQLETQLFGSDAALVTRDDPAAVVRDNRVVAYLKVLRDPDHISSMSRQPDSHDFLVRRNTTLEMVRSKALLTRVVQKQNIAELPILRKQPNPVQWLQDHLQTKYPNDAELLEIALEGGDVEQLKLIVNAVVEVYFQEVVEKQIQDREKKAAKLKQLYDLKVTELERDRKRLQPLEELTQRLSAELQKIDTQRNSPPRIERVPEVAPVAPVAPQPAATASPVAEPAKPALPTAAPEAPPQSDAKLAPTDEATLRNELQAKHEELIRAMHEQESLQRKLGSGAGADVEPRSALQIRLEVINNQLSRLNSECLTLDAEIGRLNAELDTVGNEQAKKDRAARMLRSDAILTFYNDELAMRVALDKRNVSIDAKSLDTLDTDKRVKARREELRAAAEVREAAKAKELRGKVVLKHRERDRVKEQLVALGLEHDELLARFKTASDNQATVKSLQAVVDDLNRQLYKTSIAKQRVAEEQASCNPEQVAERRQKKKGKLQELLAQKSAELERDQTDVELLRTTLGLPDAAAVSTRTSDFQKQRLQLDTQIFDQMALAAKLDGELEQLRLDIELASDLTVQKARPWKAMQYDLELKSLEQQLQDLGAATARVATMPDSENRLVANLKQAASLENAIRTRRADFMARYADDQAVATANELRAKLVTTEKQRDAARQSLSEMKARREAFAQQWQAMRQDIAQLENKEQKIKALTQLTDELKRDIERLEAAEPTAVPAS